MTKNELSKTITQFDKNIKELQKKENELENRSQKLREIGDVDTVSRRNIEAKIPEIHSLIDKNHIDQIKAIEPIISAL